MNWAEVPPLDQNGIIVQYEVEYTQTTFTGAAMFNTTIVDASIFSVNLTGLEEYVEYAIRVRAYTIVGAGPYSNTTLVATNEDGELYMKFMTCPWKGMYFFAVPTSSPSNVSVGSVSPTSFILMWQRVPAIDQNGIITQYDVEHTQAALSDDSMPVTTIVDSSIRMLELTGLEEYATYLVRVRAYTSVGAGPYSDVLEVNTSEDGVYSCLHHWYSVLMTFSLYSSCLSSG